MYRIAIVIVFGCMSFLRAAPAQSVTLLCPEEEGWKEGMLPAFEHFFAPRFNYRQCTKLGQGQRVEPCRAALKALDFYIQSCQKAPDELREQFLALEIVKDPGIIASPTKITEDAFDRLQEWMNRYLEVVENETELSAFLYNAYLKSRDDYSYIIPEETFDRWYQPESLKIEVLQNDEQVDSVKIDHFFGDQLVEEFKEILLDLERSQRPALVIDLRDNPGGHLQYVVEMLSFLLAEKRTMPLYFEKNLQGQTEEAAAPVFALNTPQLYSGEVSVLINEATASAAEIFAAAIVDQGRGKVFGSTSFGKGIMQSYRHLSESHPSRRVLFISAEKLLLRGTGVGYHLRGIQAQVRPTQ